MNQNKEENIYKWFDIVLSEYSTLRTESIESLKNQQAIVNYGLTVIGVLIGFTGGIWSQKTVVEIIYILFVPFICNFIIMIWNGEVNRMSRAGQYINRIEDKVNDMVKQHLNIDNPALYWESYLREQKAAGKKITNNKKKRNYLAILGMFALLSYLSVLIGVYHNYTISSQSLIEWLHNMDWFFAVIVILILCINTFSFLKHIKYFNKVKK